MTQLARLKPYNGKTHKLRSYTVFGIKFLESRGWYEVEDDVAQYLATVKQDESDDFSHAAFDVCTKEEALELDAKAKKIAERRAAEEANPTQSRIHRPTRTAARRAAEGTLTTSDLPREKETDFEKASGSFDEDMADPVEKVDPEKALDGADEDELDAIEDDLEGEGSAESPVAAPARGPKPRVGKPK